MVLADRLKSTQRPADGLVRMAQRRDKLSEANKSGPTLRQVPGLTSTGPLAADTTSGVANGGAKQMPRALIPDDPIQSASFVIRPLPSHCLQCGGNIL